MDQNIVPLRHTSMPGLVKLPRRYELAGNGDVTARRDSMEESGESTVWDRLEDLSQAMMWIKQELILLRQHDILLKRQFCDIQDTIKSLYRCRWRNQGRDHLCSTSSLSSTTSSVDITLENYGVRAANSISLLRDEADDYFDEDGHVEYRPRTSSMKTTRDLAALARRRGSKELI
ncbi:hypothetical protein FSP39_005590 [Pinctada imbricata]|uniref:Uncharacterized protein n=1 Tax=Pinctada imbricata TaxID=66713 RepID=A0AA88XQ56_PINIB|nr:hypothetical protein FSP39_005590 [Pinctada imbricata]